MNRDLRPVLTADGSFTLYNPSLNEHYHSLDGAIAESQYVYLEKGLLGMIPLKKKIRIFELGLGLGYNALLSCEASSINPIEVEYYSCEPHYISPHLIDQWNFFSSEENKKRKQVFESIHHLAWEKEHIIEAGFSFIKTKTPIEKIPDLEIRSQYDLIYFDAFAPSKQSDVWEKDILIKCFGMLSPKGLLVTYCSQGNFKRNMKEIGFEVNILPGFGKKREMTQAIKP